MNQNRLRIHPQTTIAAPNAGPQGHPNPPAIAAAPTFTIHHDNISLSARWNLHHVLEDGSRYEQRLYSYFNTVLTEVFPVSRNFQINHQYPALKQVEAGVAPHHDKVSISSLGELRAGRGAPLEDDMNLKFPDLFITKNISQPLGMPRVTYSLAVIEIKSVGRDAALRHIQTQVASVNSAILQLVGYCRRLSTCLYAQSFDNTGFVAGFLVYGPYYAKVTFNPPQNRWSVGAFQEVFEENSVNGDRKSLFYRLSEIAVLYWNLQ